MNLYAHDLSSLIDFNEFAFSDSIDDSFSHRRSSAFLNSLPNDDFYYNNPSLYGYGRYPSRGERRVPPNRAAPPSHHRHDGTSPLPMGMDWSPPPRKWDGRDSVWPHDPHTGWSYSVLIPSWTSQRKSNGSDPVVFYKVQVGIQTPEGVTTARGILRRFNDFLQLFSELKKAFPMKDLPPAPPKKLLRIKTEEVLEKRRCSLEDWMQKLLSDIDISRSLQTAMFLELEAAVRSSFNDVAQQSSDVLFSTSDAVPSFPLQDNSDASVAACNSSFASDCVDGTPHEISELGTTKHSIGNSADFGKEKSTSEQDLIDPLETTAKPLRLNGTEFIPEREHGHARRLSVESAGSDLSSVRASVLSNLNGETDLPGGSGASRDADAFLDPDFQFHRDLVVTLPSDERHKLNRVLMTFKQRLVTAKTDTEDLIARLNQEVAVRQFLTTKVKDLEVELETTTQNCKENMEQAILTETERFTQMQWDIEELRRKCMELELKLKSEEELDVARGQLDNLQKHHEESELKSKTEIKLLVKEVKSLRNSQSEMKQELSRLMKEKLEVERVLQKEKQRAERADTVNAKLLHECGILRSRLQECSVNFLVEEEDKLILDTSSLSDAVDLLTTSDNRIGLLLAEAQLLAQDIANAVTVGDESRSNHMNGGESRKSDDELRKMVSDILVDNATLRKQINSVIRCSLKTSAKTGVEDDEDEEDTSLRKTVLGKFLER
ncbi:PX domain-containing protein EREX isoform X2 [Morus notabilis]|uniref:PX domain-containing protein EREX isoform X2 n=1 Tax=Morus notabilis TaxID=981085 RepID=UPI000CED6168|nr:PX domain-containing protein EREX isoform X2 [Morus notabilis]